MLGKGLEKAIARRLAWEAIKRHILPPGYCGALPLCSASDLACLLTDNIQQAFSQGMVLSTVTFDVQGGFDTVLPNRLLQRLIEQQWPTNLISWIQSFLSQYLASIQLDGIKGQPFPLTGSLPQGFPASPILFMLYLKLLFAAPRTLGTLQRKSYANDGRISAKFTSLTRNCQLLEQEFQAVRQWCQEKQISLNLKKIDLMHFSCKRNNNNSSMQVLPTLSKTVIGSQIDVLLPIPLKDSLRWLGIHFDQKLTFHQHSTIIAQKGKKAAQALQMLGGTSRGTPAHVLRHATKASILPVLTFEAEAWWPPSTQHSRRHALAKKLNCVQNIALQSILPVYKITPTALLHQTTGILPIEILLDAVSRQFAICLSQLDSRHPLQICVNRKTPKNFLTYPLACPSS